MWQSYFNFARGFLLVYDITNRTSFEHLADWLAKTRESCPQSPFIIVGNKADLPDVSIGSEEPIEMVETLGVAGRIETSAKTGEHVGEAFYILAKAILNHQSGR